MDYMETWNSICLHISKNRNVKEQEFQRIVEILFEKLGWSQYKGEIVSKKSIPIGAANRLEPDIVIKNNGQEILVVELKQPDNTMTKQNAGQLSSYIRQLKLNFGILLGRTLQMYYDLPNDNKPLIQINDIPFDENLDEGVEFIKLLSKEDFSFDRLQKYCDDCLANIEKRKISQEEVDFLCFDEGEKFVTNLIKENYLAKYSEEIVSSIIDNIKVSITRKLNISEQSARNTDSQTNSTNRQNDDIDHKWLKSEAINLCKANGLDTLNHRNTTFSAANNSSTKYWANPNINKLSQNWWLLLNDLNKCELYVFYIPANSITENQIKRRGEKLIDIHINCDDKSFEDSRSKVKFEKWLTKTISY